MSNDEYNEFLTCLHKYAQKFNGADLSTLNVTDQRPAAHVFWCLFICTVHERDEWRKQFNALHSELVKVKNSADNLTSSEDMK